MVLVVVVMAARPVATRSSRTQRARTVVVSHSIIAIAIIIAICVVNGVNPSVNQKLWCLHKGELWPLATRNM